MMPQKSGQRARSRLSGFPGNDGGRQSGSGARLRPGDGLAGTDTKGADEAWRALMRDTSLQFQFPDAATPAPVPNWLVRLVEFVVRHRREIEIGAWVLLALLILAAAYFLGRGLLRRGRAQPEAQADRRLQAWEPSAQQARLLLSDADDLAAAGNYSQAVHRLLLVAIQEVGQRRPGLVVPSLTSREIATLTELSALARQIFFAIALVVERSRFGNRSLGAAEYGECRAAFERFTRAGVWQAAA